MIIPLPHLLVFSLALLCIGIFGAIVRRNIIGILISIEIILNAVNVNFVSFAAASKSPIPGQVFAIFVISIAAAGAAVGLAIVLALYRSRKSVMSDKMNLLKW